ncbi:MAG: hypothetical protein WD604_06800 [Balneolaceae bacterium]
MDNLLEERAVQLHQAGQYEEASKLFTKLIRNNPSEILHYLQLAGCFRDMGNFDRAMIFAQGAKKINIKDLRVYMFIASIHLKNGDLLDGLRELTMAKKNCGENIPVLNNFYDQLKDTISRERDNLDKLYSEGGVYITQISPQVDAPDGIPRLKIKFSEYINTIMPYEPDTGKTRKLKKNKKSLREASIILKLTEIEKSMPYIKEEAQEIAQTKQAKDVLVKNPKAKGKEFHIQVTESVKPFSKWQLENIVDCTKEDPRNMRYLTKDNYLIFFKHEVVLGEAKHIIIEENGATNDPHETENYNIDDI